jgi:hypothetical protein
MNVPELSPEMAKLIDDHFVPWWKVRAQTCRKGPVRKLLLQELDDAVSFLPYVMLSSPQLEGSNILLIRSKTATLIDILRSFGGIAKADVITLFPPYRYLAEKCNGIRAIECLDFETFKIPFADSYDLIIERHLLIHALDPKRMFSTFRKHLNDRGVLFLQKEYDDSCLCDVSPQNLFAEFRPFHFQYFDKATLRRVLACFGFTPTMINNRKRTEIVGAAVCDRNHTDQAEQLGSRDLRFRLAMYERWRDESILSLPRERSETLFGGELREISRRVKARGGFELDTKGKPKALRRFREAGIDDEQTAISFLAQNYQNRFPSRLTKWAKTVIPAIGNFGQAKSPVRTLAKSRRKETSSQQAK